MIFDGFVQDSENAFFGKLVYGRFRFMSGVAFTITIGPVAEMVSVSTWTQPFLTIRQALIALRTEVLLSWLGVFNADISAVTVYSPGV